MPYIEREGVQIHYEAAGSGPPVLITHGFGSSTKAWEGQAETLSDAYRIITWDMRGHAGTDSPVDPAQYSEAATVDDMAAILDHLGIEKAVIGGLSLGGYMSLAFNLKYPERVRALMLFDTGPGYNNPKGREAWNETAFRRAERFEQKGLDALGQGAEVRISVHRSAEGLAKAARGMLAQFNDSVIRSLEQIEVATLVLVGANDEPFLGATDYMANKIPGATKVVIPGAGHASNLDQPAAFDAAVREFLGSLPG
ncbi:MAG: alpha/beta fold hydrolase [Dehalococcoidia bacterium]|nr:alpha/beta fold hydrolase [Dehalococcoidia bacterium]